jgi:hypothetical protein
LRTEGASPGFVRSPARRLVPLLRYHKTRWQYLKAAAANPKFANGTHKVFRFREQLDTEALRRSVSLLQRRHRILRAHVSERKKVLYYSFGGPRADVETLDLSRVSRQTRLARARAAASGLVWRLFPDEGPWLRVFVIKLGRRDHVIGIVLHHFIADAVSVNIALAELLSAYSSYAAGRRPSLPRLSLQYTDYIDGLAGWLDSRACRRQEAFWRQSLAGAPATGLPAARLDPGETGLAMCHRFKVPVALVSKLRTLTNCNNLAMLALVAAAMALALAQGSGARDIVLRTTVSGRTDLRFAGLIGAFFESVSLRFAIRDNGRLGDFLETARAVLLGALAHQSYSSHLVGAMLAPIGASDDAPVLHFFNYFHGAGTGASGKLENFDISEPPRRRLASDMPNISLHLIHKTDGLYGFVEYLDIRYRRAAIRRFAGDFIAALARLAGQPDCTVAELMRHGNPVAKPVLAAAAEAL